MFHSLLSTWLGLVEHWGYGGVFLLMALESTVFPIPSEIIVPPAAYLASRGAAGGAAGAMSLLSWWHYRQGVHRCVHCGRPLKGIGIFCDCPAVQALGRP